MLCPSCQNQIEVLDKHFGTLFTCPQCQSVYFINFDGTPDFNSATSDGPELFNESVKSEQSMMSEEPVESEVSVMSEVLDSTEEIMNSIASPSISTAMQAIASEIEDFGNKETVPSGITYDFEISNIDSKEAMQSIKEALVDSKLEVDLTEMEKGFKKGFFSIHGLSAVQSFVILRRLQFLDIKMKWKQNVVTQ